MASTPLSPSAVPPYPRRFYLAKRYADEGGLDASAISDSDQLLLYALAQQAIEGANTTPKPSMFDSTARAKWNAWRELGDQKRSQMECMVLYVNAVEELAPEWWR